MFATEKAQTNFGRVMFSIEITPKQIKKIAILAKSKPELIQGRPIPLSKWYATGVNDKKKNAIENTGTSSRTFSAKSFPTQKGTIISAIKLRKSRTNPAIRALTTNMR